jgi:hypothetical protein
MIYDKLIALTKRLLQSTRMQKLEWRMTASQDRFTVAFSDRAVAISEEMPHDEDPRHGMDYFLTITNADGDVIERVSDNELRAEWSDVYSVMRELFEAARRSAMGADKAVDDILGEIDKLDGDDIPF